MLEGGGRVRGPVYGHGKNALFQKLKGMNRKRRNLQTPAGRKDLSITHHPNGEPDSEGQRFFTFWVKIGLIILVPMIREKSTHSLLPPVFPNCNGSIFLSNFVVIFIILL